MECTGKPCFDEHFVSLLMCCTVQTKLGNHTFIIYLQIYVDATHVTSFGNIKYWGVFIWVGNVPKADRNDRGGRGRAMLIAYLPVVSLNMQRQFSQLRYC